MTSTTRQKEDHYRLSSVYYKQLSLGANFMRDEDGWIRAERFTKPEDENQKTIASVGLSDVSHLGKLSLKSNNVIEKLGKEVGRAQIEPHTAFRANTKLFGDALLSVLTNEEALVIARMSDCKIISEHLGQGERDCFHVTDLTSYFTGFYLIGPESREVVSKLTEVNVNPDAFPDFAVSQLPLFHVRSILFRQDIHDMPGFQIYFDRGFGEYLWDKIMLAGKEFGIVPVGSSALKLLGWRWN